jgi:hypothetical protein
MELLSNLATGFNMAKDAYNQATRVYLPDQTPEQAKEVEDKVRSLDTPRNISLIGIIAAIAFVVLGIASCAAGSIGGGVACAVIGVACFWLAYNTYKTMTTVQEYVGSLHSKTKLHLEQNVMNKEQADKYIENSKTVELAKVLRQNTFLFDCMIDLIVAGVKEKSAQKAESQATPAPAKT